MWAKLIPSHLLAWLGLMALSLVSAASPALAAPSLPVALVAQALSVAFVALLLGFGLVSGPLVAGLLAVRLRPRTPVVRLAPAAVLAVLALALVGRARADQWSTDLCVSPSGLGASSEGAPFTILGSAGSSVRRLRLYRNNGRDGYLRGVSVFFSDGTEMRGGVRKDQFADVELSDGEVITGMTLWKLDGAAANSSSSAARVARLDLSTSERSWGYGVENTGSLTSKAVSVGSGVLVGFQGRAGDDLDFLAPIFLKPLSESTVSDIVFEKAGSDDGLRLVTLREGSAVYNGTDFSWTFSGSESRDSSTSFSSGFTNSLSISTTFKSKIPAIAEAGVSGSWTPGTSSSHDQHSGSSVQLSWSNTIALSKDSPAVSCSAMVWEGRLNVAWSGTQTVSAGGATMSFATSGTLRHVAYGKVETVCRPMSAVARRWVA